MTERLEEIIAGNKNRARRCMEYAEETNRELLGTYPAIIDSILSAYIDLHGRTFDVRVDVSKGNDTVCVVISRKVRS